MSTILDALKRLENEHHKEKRRQPPTALSGEAVTRFRFRFQATVLTLAALATIGGAGAFLWIEKGPSEAVPDHVKHRPEQATARSSLPMPANADTVSSRSQKQVKGIAARAEADPAPAPLRPLKREETDVAEAAAPQKVAPVYSKAFQARKRNGPSPQEQPLKEIRHHDAPKSQSTPHALNNARTGGGPSMSVSAMAAKQGAPPTRQAGLKPSSIKPETLRGKSVASQPASNQDPYASVETIPRGALQLQAISWSNVPGARITVIDGRILHEGQTIGEYTVTRIRPDDIILKKAGQPWKLGYTNR